MPLKKMLQNKSTQVTYKDQIGIIDDDPIAADFMRTRLLQKFSQCSVTVYNEPIVVPMLDVYFVDNDFNGQHLATELLREIRELNPNALVVAMSSTLDQPTMLALMNGGCNAVYDKNQPHSCDAVFEVIENYLSVLKGLRAGHTRSPLRGCVLSLRELLHEWNSRLSKNNV